jgi:predicted  nucleic acid-binding Zn-ribbon protein
LLEALSIPPRLVLRALDDLHTLAEGIRRLTESDADMDDLLTAVRDLPRVEDELSATAKELQSYLPPLIEQLRGMDDTAEALEKELAGLQVTITGFHAEIKDLRDRIPGI